MRNGIPKKLKMLLVVFFIAMLSVFVLSCGGDGGGGDGGGDSDEDGDGIVDSEDACNDVLQCEDVSGNWLLEVGEIESTCGKEAGWSSDIVIDQVGCTLSVTGIKDAPPSYVVSGCALITAVWFGPGHFDEDGGRTTTTFTMDNLDLEDTMVGRETWYWVSDDDAHHTCTEGKAVVVMTRPPPID